MGVGTSVKMGGDSSVDRVSEVYAGSKLCLSLDMCTDFAKPCEYAWRCQMSR